MSIKPLSQSSKIWVGQKGNNTIEDNSNFYEEDDYSEIPQEEIITESTIENNNNYPEQTPPKMSFYLGGIKITKPSKALDITELYDLIKSDKYKAKVEEIRNQDTKDVRDKLKANLDYITPAGIFEARNNDKLSECSGYAPIDIDNVESGQLEDLKNKLKNDEYITLLFTSPSGNGLKAIITIPQERENYSLYVEGFYDYLEGKYNIEQDNLDRRSDISRACYVSHDPEAYLNKNSELFYQKRRVLKSNKSKQKREHIIFELWTEDFFLNYCLNNKLPEGERHTVVEKNMAIWLRGREDRDEIIKHYCEMQNQPMQTFNGWLAGEKYNEVNARELEKFIKRYDIKYTIPEIKNKSDLIKHVADKLILKQTTEATESIVKYFKDRNRIYTTRDDISSEVWIYKDGIYIPQGKTFITEFVREITEKAFTTYFCNQVIAKIEADTYINQDEFFNKWDKEEIIILNGILNLNDRTLSDYTPDKIFFNKIPVVYDPEKRCPNIEEHLQTVLKYKEDVKVIYEIFGFLLWKDYFIEKAIMLSGGGRNGKGKTVELMKRFLGPDNCANIPLQQLDNDQFALGELFNKMANLSPDISSTALGHTGYFKSLTGRDLISAPRKFLTRVNFVNHAKMIFCANEIPKTYDTSEAFWNRWVLLEFPYTFLSKKEYDCRKEKKDLKIADTQIIQKLTSPEEMSGLLNKALDGLDRIRGQGDFSYSKNTEEVKNMWIRKSDSFMAFFMDCCEKVNNDHTFKDDLGQAYSLYCEKRELKQRGSVAIKNTLSMLNIWDERKADGVDGDGKTKYRWAWCNIRVLTDEEQKKREQTLLQGEKP